MTQTQPDSVDPNAVYRKVPAEAQCDLIMKGGITSGVVYPPAILELAKTYRFRAIGGASAGAIAAAATAAAEFGRETGGGFASLQRMQEDLARPGFLLGLFQPTPATRPLFQGLLFAQGWWAGRPREASWWGLLRDLRRAWREKQMRNVFEASPGEARYFGQGRGITVAALLLLACVVPWAMVWMSAFPSPWVRGGILVLLAAVSVALLWVGAALGGVLQPLADGVRCAASPDSLFSLCTGFATEGGSGESLTAWMHRSLQEMAGLSLDEPLTLGHLRKSSIDFKAVTTDLTQGQPFALPLDKATNLYVFNAQELGKLFPKEVVDWMVKKAPLHTDIQLPKDFHIFVTGDDMPLLVAMRMSLSFPVLLSALRLYTVHWSVFAAGDKAKKASRKHAPVPTPEQLQPHWFSDGGIASNFPIHLFDSWLPVRPTFGINLRDSALPLRHGVSPEKVHAPEGAPPIAANPPAEQDDVVLLRPREYNEARAPLTQISSLPQFLGAIFETAQSFRDNTQAALPGYRERIAHVYLEQGEGGLNLAMPAKVVERIATRGRKVAHLFTDPARFNFREHQWVRLRTLLTLLERELGRVCIIRGATQEGFTKLRQDFQALLEEQKTAYAGSGRWYCPVNPRKNELWFEQAGQRLDALVTLMETWAELQRQWDSRPSTRGLGEKRPDPFYFFQKSGPKPAGMLRVTPEL